MESVRPLWREQRAHRDDKLRQRIEIATGIGSPVRLLEQEQRLSQPKHVLVRDLAGILSRKRVICQR